MHSTIDHWVVFFQAESIQLQATLVEERYLLERRVVMHCFEEGLLVSMVDTVRHN